MALILELALRPPQPHVQHHRRHRWQDDHCPARCRGAGDTWLRACAVHAHAYVRLPISLFRIVPLLFKMACKQDLGLRCGLAPAPWVLGPNHVSNPEY